MSGWCGHNSIIYASHFTQRTLTRMFDHVDLNTHTIAKCSHWLSKLKGIPIEGIVAMLGSWQSDDKTSMTILILLCRYAALITEVVKYFIYWMTFLVLLSVGRFQTVACCRSPPSGSERRVIVQEQAARPEREAEKKKTPTPQRKRKKIPSEVIDDVNVSP